MLFIGKIFSDSWHYVAEWVLEGQNCMAGGIGGTDWRQVSHMLDAFRDCLLIVNY